MKTGLFFGSFNPIHIGHLAIANFMVEYTDMEEIWFVVSPHNPLKKKSTLLNDSLRLAMVNIAIDNDPRIKSCDIEFSLPQPSYTIHTLTCLKQKHPDREFAIVMGSDGLCSFDQWKCCHEIMTNFKRYVYPRPGTPPQFIRNITNGEIINAPLMDISSTFIRNAIQNGKDLRHFVPSNVWKFICDHHLYLTKNPEQTGE